ncbi:iron-siderophore ABC transporter substrate-binding protein [Gloeocapsopsis crepidinum LEGE 06123]|uniref:Iron-siderophore ABC transporter substrate-binding protein n=1 Tax=Gloeocapsopsis crepidinum LEGE 06123 TaxID=588587 RepID=A0ABR9UKP0_9CHRO|nr:iron-siderophore ABC transporter substrate-binding protein [Gloeocapsopsis crepidinum]MBE9188851.1 iron-siderophore ABC transporter substrate-binding protein [Gloeocapsopsis crepidinum LEGE 06123]
MYKLLARILLILCFTAACDRTPPKYTTSTSCQDIQHEFGSTQICKTPQRVIALDPRSLDLLLSLDVQPIGYAEDARVLLKTPQFETTIDVKYLGDRITTNPVYVGTWQAPSQESVLKLKPDLILLGYGGEQSLYMNFSQIAPTLPLSQSDRHWQEDLLTLSRVMNRAQRAQQVIQNHNQRIADTRAKLKAVAKQQLLLLSISGLDSIEVFTEETFAGNLLTELGFELVVPKLPVRYGAIPTSLEILPQLDADIVIVMASGDSTVSQIQKLWEQSPVLRSLPVYQANQVHFVDYHLWSRITGPIATELITKQLQQILSI